MAANGSPVPEFETDDDRCAYAIRLPVHPLAKMAELKSEEVTPEVTPEVERVLNALPKELSRQGSQEAIGLKDST